MLKSALILRMATIQVLAIAGRRFNILKNLKINCYYYNNQYFARENLRQISINFVNCVTAGVTH